MHRRLCFTRSTYASCAINGAACTACTAGDTWTAVVAWGAATHWGATAHGEAAHGEAPHGAADHGEAPHGAEDAHELTAHGSAAAYPNGMMDAWAETTASTNTTTADVN